MAEIVLTHKFQTITLADDEQHEINFDNMLQDNVTKNPYGVTNGIAAVDLVSGASVQFSPNADIDSDAGAIVTANPKAMIDIRRGGRLRVKGGAGSEVINVSILSD